MTRDLLHNKIIKETITESFICSVNDCLVPKLRELYGASLDGIQMYEDYIKEIKSIFEMIYALILI